MRDTDADWREIGASYPYWGVLTAPEYRQERLSPEVLEAFYASGREHIVQVASRLEALAGRPLRVETALDFGCGAGRLAEAMTAYADQVTGVDVSPGMLAEARRNSGGRVIYGESLPEALVDWINSFIVFQHIPPERGLVLLAQLLDRLKPAGLLSLHLTLYRESHLMPPQPPGPKRRSLAARLLGTPPAPPPQHAVGEMMMYDYDMNQVLAALHRRGVRETLLVHTDHGGHHGVMIFGRQDG